MGRVVTALVLFGAWVAIWLYAISLLLSRRQHPTSPTALPPGGREAVEPAAASARPSPQAPATHPELAPMLGEVERRVQFAWLEEMWAQPAYHPSDDCPPRGIPRPPTKRRPRPRPRSTEED